MRVDARALGAIFAGGFAGAVARAELAQVLPAGSAHWPWATFFVNIAGAFLIGAVAARWYGLVGVGFCGALTTFSTMQLELLRMLDASRVGLALGYALASVVVGIAAVTAGTWLARRRTALADPHAGQVGE